MSGQTVEREGRRLATRVSLLFAAVFAIAGTHLPYLPVWLDWIGLGAREIAVITAAPMLARVAVTPAIAFAADRSGDHRRVLVVLAWGALAAALALAQCASFWPVLALTLLFAIATSTIMPLAETVAMAGVKAAGLDYGRMRLWGSLSFIAASFCGGLVMDRLGAPAAVWLLAGGAALTVLAATGCPAQSDAAVRSWRPRGHASVSPMRWVSCARAYSSRSCWRWARCRPRTRRSTPSALCIGLHKDFPAAGRARSGPSAWRWRSASWPSRAPSYGASGLSS